MTNAFCSNLELMSSESELSHSSVIGAGFIGKHLIRRLLSEGISLNILDHNLCPLEFTGKLKWIVGDYHDIEALSSAIEGSNTIYHLVSGTVPGDQNVNIATEINENVLGTLNLISMAIKHGVRRIVFVSSASVYGIQDNFPIREASSTNPISVHGIHKLMIEKFLLLNRWQNSIDIKILRLSNPYGPGQSLNGRQGFIGIAIGSILQNKILTIRGDGKIIRDFIYIDDAVTGIVNAGLHSGSAIIFNISSSKGYTLKNLISVLENVMERVLPINYVPQLKIDIPISILDNSLARNDLGLQISTNLVEGLIKTVRSHSALS